MRNLQYKLNPTKSQSIRIDDILRVAEEIYNGSLRTLDFLTLKQQESKNFEVSATIYNYYNDQS